MSNNPENKQPESSATTSPATPEVKAPVNSKLTKTQAKVVSEKANAKKTPAAKTQVAKPAKVVSAPIKATPKVKATPKATAKIAKPKTDAPLQKPEKIKMERDSFTMPREEYAQIATLKKRLDVLGKPAKKSELLRAGLKLLAGMDDALLLTSLAAIPTIKTGRPKN